MFFVPKTEQIEKEYAGRISVQRLDVMDPEGARLRRERDLQLVPAFVLLDAAGEERWRGGTPPKASDLQLVGI